MAVLVIVASVALVRDSARYLSCRVRFATGGICASVTSAVLLLAQVETYRLIPWPGATGALPRCG